jgi:hypothetical protein
MHRARKRMPYGRNDNQGHNNKGKDDEINPDICSDCLGIHYDSNCIL